MYVQSVQALIFYFIFISESEFSSLYFKLLFYRTSSKVLLNTVSDTCNDFLVQYECSYYIFRKIQP